MFDKYLRAISDENERKEILRLLRFRIAAMAVAVAALIALVVESVVFDGIIEKGGEAPMWPGYITIALFAAGLIGYFVLRAVFWSRFCFILTREPKEGEPEELTLYRKKLRAERTEDRAAIKKYSKFAIVGLILFVVLLVAEVILYPEKEELGALSLTGLVLFAVGLVVSFICYGIYDEKKKKNKTDDSDIAAKLDEMQGREYRYSLKEDKNARSLDYLFPTPEIREKAEKYKKNYGIQLLSTVIVASMMAFCTVCVFCFGKVLEINLSGFAYPIFVTMVLILTLLASIQPLHYLFKVEKEQLKELETNTEYSKNLEIYKMYEEYSRFKGKTALFAVIASIAVSLLVAAFIPDKPWSALSVVIIVGGLLLHNKLYGEFRKSVIPLEKEIDAMKAEKAVADDEKDNGEADFSNVPRSGEEKDEGLKF